MTKIEEFLTKFDDQHLANLQCAAEDGTLVYHNCNRCLLHYFRGDYSVTKWESEHAELARDAEREYRDLGKDEVTPFTEEVEIGRRAGLLPMIHAEWTRRGRMAHHDWRKIGQDFNEMQELYAVRQDSLG